MRDDGLIMNIEGQAEVIITSYYAENLINKETSGSAFILSENIKLTLNNVYINNLIGNGEEGGLFYTSHDSLYIEFIANNITLYNLYQSNRHDTSIIHIEKNNNVYIDGFKLFNSGGYNTNFINMLDNSFINIYRFEVDYFESKTAKEFINYESDVNYYEKESGRQMNILSNFKVSNVISQGVLFRIKNGRFNINNCNFRNIHVCYKYNNCTNFSSESSNVQDAELYIGYGGNRPIIYVSYMNIDQIYGDIGILIYTAGISMTYSKVSNSYFKNGLFHWNELNLETGSYIIQNSTFENNTSESGTIFNFSFISQGSEKFFTISDLIFINNTASKFGGVVYSIGENNLVKFSNCSYYNNHASSGNTLYVHSKGAMPNIGELDSNDISTIPAYFEIQGYKEISILSGESIPEDIMCNINKIEYKNKYYYIC